MKKNNNTYDDWKKSDLIKEILKLKKEKLGLVWEDQNEEELEALKNNFPYVEEIVDQRILNDKELPVNSIFEGENLHTLSLLNFTHKGAFDLIYIDPPYNTGARNWIYNNDFTDKEDSYRHSRWLSFMSKRLKLSKPLLKKDGVLICAIDENELAHLVCILENIFKSHEIHIISIVHNPGGKQGKNISYTHEYAVFVIPKNKRTFLNKKLHESEIRTSPLRNWGGESERKHGKNTFYPIVVKNNEIIDFGEVCKPSFHPDKRNIEGEDNTTLIYPIDDKGIERKWRYQRDKFSEIKDQLVISKSKSGDLDIKITKKEGTYKSFWNDSKYDASTYGTKLLRGILKDCKFDFPKSLWTTYDCLDAIIGENKDALVLDFFAGSGTTGHAVLEMNNNDGGNRSFILCSSDENPEINIPKKITYERIKKIISGYKNLHSGKAEQAIKANLKYYKIHLKKGGTDDSSKKSLGKKIEDLILIKENGIEQLNKSKEYKLFSSNKGLIVIVPDIINLPSAIERIKEFEEPIIFYIFSFSDEDFSEEIDEISNLSKVNTYPEPYMLSHNNALRKVK